MSESVPPQTVLHYRIDDADRITSVGGAWCGFAQENEGGRVKPENVIGRPLWDFICDATTIELYRQMVKRARAGQVVKFHYRCDAPERRRLFRMTIAPVPPAEIEFVSALRREEVRPKVMLLDAELRNRSEEFVRICSWCEKAALPDGRWAPLEVVVEVQGLLQKERMPSLTHGICEHCKQRLLRQMNVARVKRDAN